MENQYQQTNCSKGFSRSFTPDPSLARSTMPL